MSTQTVTYACGHTQQQYLNGSPTRQQTTLDWLRHRLCWTCQLEADTQEARTRAAREGWPAITVGSTAQCEWAERIRLEKVMAIEALRSPAGQADLWGGADDIASTSAEHLTAAIAWLVAHDEASWWIDRRRASVSELLAECNKE